MFLYRFYESAKCNNVLKNNNSDEADLCLSSIKYDADNNILSVFVRVLPGAEAMDDFVDVELDERREILLTLLDNTVRRMGAVDTWGLMHSIPISHGWNASQADEKLFRAELAKRNHYDIVNLIRRRRVYCNTPSRWGNRIYCQLIR